MSWVEDDRARRRHNVSRSDQRSAFQRDRDRILYSSAFRRLSGITQIVRADEADVFHTRQQHTLKVAQVGRRLAELRIEKQPHLALVNGVNPEVVEAACLAHDLGHPPFGHVGEHTLHQLVVDHQDEGGYEGNAQSFRVLTKLAVRFENCDGLDLTRATLAAVLKYPWVREPDDPSRTKKWGSYQIDRDEFNFARSAFVHSSKTAEAEMMDWADDIAYSVHDLEDFHRCGAIPWRRILAGDRTEALVRAGLKAWYGAPADAEGRLREALRNLHDFLVGSFAQLLDETYEGSRAQRQQLRTMTSQLIARFITALELVEPDEQGVAVRIDQDKADEVRILKQITRDYVIDSPSLAAQQRGQERLIRNLFLALLEGGENGYPRFAPVRLRYLWAEEVPRARSVADCISSLTEREAIALHNRLFGEASGSVLDPIVR